VYVYSVNELVNIVVDVMKVILKIMIHNQFIAFTYKLLKTGSIYVYITRAFTTPFIYIYIYI